MHNNHVWTTMPITVGLKIFPKMNVEALKSFDTVKSKSVNVVVIKKTFRSNAQCQLSCTRVTLALFSAMKRY